MGAEWGDDDDPVGALSDLGLTSFELLLMANGRTREQAAAECAEKTRINALADKIKGKPAAEWPPFDIVWDISPESYFLTLDGADSGTVDTNELDLVWVKLGDLDAILQPHNHRTRDEVWSVGDPNKAARALVHWSEGRSMSPVWIVPATPAKVGFVGGNHRLAIARAKNVKFIPVLIEKKHIETVARLIELLPAPEQSTSET